MLIRAGNVRLKAAPAHSCIVTSWVAVPAFLQSSAIRGEIGVGP